MDDKIFVLASFAKAAYSTRHVGYTEDPRINDTSPYVVPTGQLTSADESYQYLLADGWKPIDIIPNIYNQYTSAGYISYGMMSDGFYINENAAALVMQKDDTLVLAFRGTNDYDGDTKDTFFNPFDPQESIQPDKNHWNHMDWHYELFDKLREHLRIYGLDSRNDIKKLYVTGHSLGGSMAIHFLHENQFPPLEIQGVTFAASAFVSGTFWRFDYPKDSRLTQVEIGNDGVPLTWDYKTSFGANSRPGHRIVIWGNEILNSPDDTPIPIFGYPSNASNHSMDLYLAIAKQIDGSIWEDLAASPETVHLMLGAERVYKPSDPIEFVVDGYSTASRQQLVELEGDILALPWFYDPMYPDQELSITIDVAYGGNGNDRIDFWNNGALVGITSANLLGGVGNDTLIGGNGNDTLIGAEDNDSLEGGNGNDRLIGGSGNDIFEWNAALRAGSDTLEGGSGDDTYVVSTGDLVIELAEEGNDTILSANSYSLQSLPHVENISLFGTSGVSATGNDKANVLKGNDGPNNLNGLGGTDSIDGGAGNDAIDGGEGNDSINGGDGNDLLTGGLGNDLFDGTASLRKGNDTMKGGAGDDTYVIDSASDVIVELLTEGNDTIIVGFDFTLEGTEVENLRTFSGFASNLRFTGSAASNIIAGGQGQDSLFGMSGNDTLDGGTGSDSLEGGEGADRLQGGDGADTLSGGSDSDTLLGGAGDDVIDGNASNDWLDGGAGDDVLNGGSGSDSLLGGDGIDVAVYAGSRGNYSINWSATTTGTVQLSMASSAEGTDALTGIERLRFADGATYFVSTVDVEVRAWKTTQPLPSLEVSFGPTKQTTDAAGLTRFVSIMESSAAATTAVESTSAGADQVSGAVTLQDAVSILKMIAGLPAGAITVSRFQSLAADFDGSGTVSLADALGVLRHAVGLQAPKPSWVFVEEGDVALPSILSPAIPGPVTVDVTAPGPIEVNLVGVLRGDVDGSYGVYGG